MNNFLSKVRNVSLMLFVFGVNFEHWDPFGLVGIFSIAKMTAILYIISWIPFLQEIKIKFLKPFLIPILIYLLVDFISSIINSFYITEALSVLNFKLLQLLILLILIVNQILKDETVLELVLYSFILNVTLLGFLSSLGIGTEIDQLDRSRLVMFGENPNSIGMKAAFALVIIFNFFFDKKRPWIRIGLVFCMIPIFSMLIATASRGALLSVFIGLVLITVLKRESIFQKILLIVSGISLSTWLFSVVLTSDLLITQRMNLLIEDGQTGRDKIWAATYKIILDNPIIGVGRPGALTVMKEYYGKEMDPHNVFLFVFMTTGFIGFSFFMIFIFRLAYRLFIHFRITNNILYIILFAILIFNMSKAGGFINKTFLWVFFALLVGSTFSFYRKKINLSDS